MAIDEAIKNANDELKTGLQADFEHAAQLLKKREAKLKDLCNQTGLYYDSSRCGVFSVKTENGIKSWGRSVAQKAVAANKRAEIHNGVLNKTVDKGGKSGIIDTYRGVNMQIDKLTPCLENAKTREIVQTAYKLASKEELSRLEGWKFNWTDKGLENSEVYKLTLKDDEKIQGLIALTKFERDKAVYVNIVESAPHNLGKNKQYNGVGGHLYAIAVQKSIERGYGGFVFMDAKNMELVKHYKETLGATLLGHPHEYRMFIDEENAQKLVKIYTLKEE